MTKFQQALVMVIAALVSLILGMTLFHAGTLREGGFDLMVFTIFCILIVTGFAIIFH